MTLGIVCFVACCCGWIAPDTEDRFEAENKATSVRPGPGIIAKEAKGKGKSATGASEAKVPMVKAENVAKIADYAGTEVEVRGKVVSVFIPKTEGLCVLNFGKNHRNSFSAVIFGRNLDAWSGGADEIKKLYTNKVVTVRGVVKLRDKLPQIEVRGPAQVKSSAVSEDDSN